MKNFLITSAFLLSSFAAKSQVELSANPFLLLWGYVQAGVDLNVTEDWSIGADVFAAEGGGLVYATGKYFFSPRQGCDKFNVGAFIGGGGGDGDTALGVGFLLGYKAVSSKRVLLDMALGAGRGSGGLEVFPYFKFNLGYRFQLKK